MGVPLDADGLTGFAPFTAADVERVSAERDLPPSVVDGDVSVGELVAARFGRAVVELLVEPLLGGVYAGRADLISARAALPQLVDHAVRGSVLDQADAIPTTYAAPVFAGIPGGMGLLPAAVVAAGGFAVRTGVVARRLARDRAGFRLTVGSAASPETVSADEVVLATPAARGGPVAGRPRTCRGRRARRRRSGVGRGRHVRVPGIRGGRPARLGLPGAARRGPRDQGVDVLVRQVGLDPGGRRGAWPRR